MGKALVVIGHRPAMANPAGQIPIRTREVVDVVEYKKAPGGMADDEWWNSVDSQWWIIRSKEGLVGRVPMTSLELIEEAGKTTQELGSGYVAGDSAKKGQDAQKSWVMSNSEWNIGTCARLAKVFRDLKYNEWSKWAQLFAVYVVVLECVCIFVWEYNESDRIDELNANQSFFLHQGHTSVNFSTALLAAIAGKCTLPNAGENITSSSCDWVVDGDGEIETINLGVAAGSVGIYLLFIVFERSFGPPKADLQGREGMRNATKHPGPPRIARAIVNVGVGVTLVVLQPSVCIAGWACLAVGALSVGATIKGDQDKSYPAMYTAKNNPLPCVSRLQTLCEKAADDDRAKDAKDAAVINAGNTTQSWYQRQQQSDRFSKLVFMFVYLVTNVALFLWWGYTQAAPHKSDSSKPESLRMNYICIFIAKGFGMCLNFNCALIAIPVITTVLHKLHHSTSLSKYVPLGKNITFHRYIAYFIAFCVALHTVAHFVNYSLRREQALLAFPYEKCKLPYCGGLSFRAHEAWYTGIIIIICMVLMYSAGQESVKRDCFNAFWMSHHLFCVFWACLLIHGPIFYWFALAPLPLYFYGRIQRDRESVDKVYLEEVVIEPPNVIKLVMNNRTVGNGDDRTLWKYDSGMYLKISCPFLSPFEWHPFTISSAPEGPWLTCHIKVTRPTSWTGRLKKFLNAMNPEGLKTCVFYSPDQKRLGQWRCPLPQVNLPILKVDGPHSAPCQHISEFRDVILVGAGIGLTPFASTLASLIDFKWVSSPPRYPRSCYLHWSFRMTEFSNFAWFVRLLAELRARYISLEHRDLQDTRVSQAGGQTNFSEIRLEIYLYDTSPKLKDDKKRSNAEEILNCASCVTPTEIAGSDLDSSGRVKARHEIPVTVVATRDHPARNLQAEPLRAGELAFRKGASIELISSTARSALLEKAPFLHGQTTNPNDGVIMGWFDAEFAQPVRDESREIEGDVVNGEPELAFDDMGQPNPKITTIELKDKKGGVSGFDKGLLHVRFGRPNWNVVFPEVRDIVLEQPLVKSDGNTRAIGVFCCGPMGKALRAACMKWSKVSGDDAKDVIFKLHAEVF